ncbi:MAG: VPDSG-CTERM sorting domain-containing protein, partial [Verrucomicrobiales bacterium]
TASLSGSLVNRGNSNLTFDISLTFGELRSLTETGGPGTNPPKNGGGGIPADWDYYMEWGGTLTGTGQLSGTIHLEGVSGKPFFQVGDGANDKDIDFGASGWMDYWSDGLTREWVKRDGTQKSRSIGGFDTRNTGGHGDVNIDLQFKSRTTVPDAGGTAALLGLSILGISIAKRGKRRS